MVRLGFVAGVLAVLTACLGAHGPASSKLNSASAINDASTYAHVPEAERTTTAQVLYFTDRVPMDVDNPPRAYGYDRSTEIRFGTVDVALGKKATWDELMARSTAGGKGGWPVTVASYDEVGKIRDLRETIDVTKAGVVGKEPEVQAAWEDAQPFMDMVADRARSTGDVYVMLHGFAAGFAESAMLTAKLWHTMGRHGAAVAYSWPAGKGGFIPVAYQHDRESGEFTVLDFKALLSVLAAIPEVERVHLVAHSRGTDVVVTALRELLLQYDRQEGGARTEFKLDTVLLASPDIDIEVFQRRVMIEGVINAARRFIVYVSPNDGALGASQWMQASDYRAGRFDVRKLDEYTSHRIEDDPKAVFQVIQVDKKVYGGSHKYFLYDPVVSSDVVMALRDHKDPGDGRPLTPTGQGVWLIDDTYETQLTAP